MTEAIILEDRDREAIGPRYLQIPTHPPFAGSRRAGGLTGSQPRGGGGEHTARAGSLPEPFFLNEGGL